MSQCVIEIEADVIEMGQPWQDGRGPVHQSVRLYQGGVCVCHMSVVFMAPTEHAGSVRFINGREAGQRD